MEEELGPDWEREVVVESREVMGSGCCAQVYRGHLSDGTQVAVKVLHPGIVSSTELDLALIRFRLVHLHVEDCTEELLLSNLMP